MIIGSVISELSWVIWVNFNIYIYIYIIYIYYIYIYYIYIHVYICIYIYIYIYIYILTVQGKTMAEDAKRKFSVWKAHSWRVFKPKFHNLIVNEKNKKLGILQYIHLYIYLSFTLLNIVLCFSYHHQNFKTQVLKYRKFWLWQLMRID